MDYSDNGQHAQANRNDLILNLLEASQQANDAYLEGRLDRDEWAQQLREIDAKLRVVGIGLTNRPWSETGAKTF